MVTEDYVTAVGPKKLCRTLEHEVILDEIQPYVNYTT